MLEFIKKFLGLSPKESLKTEIRESDLNRWYDERLKKSKEQLDAALNEIKEKIANETIHIKENIDALEKAELRNPDISKREIQFMEGNRIAYVRKMKAFASQINIEGQDYQQIQELCKTFDKDLASLGKSTLRQYMIIQNFFANEAREVALNIRNIESYFKGLKNAITESQYSKLFQIREKVHGLEAKKESKRALAEELESHEKELKGLENEKEKAEKRISEDEKSKEYEEYKEQERSLKELKKNISGEEQALFHNFSVIENALKKFQRKDIENEKLIKYYLEDPISAIASDNEMKIIGIVEKMLLLISNDRLDLKDKKKGKTIIALNEMNEAYFRHYTEKMRILSEKREEIEERIALSKIVQEISASKSRLEEIEAEMANAKRRIEIIRADIDKINLDKIKKNIQLLVKETINEDIIIT